MLVLSRKVDETIIIGDNISITILQSKGNRVRIGVEAPRNVRVLRGELPPSDSGQAEPSETSASENNASETSASNTNASPSRQPENKVSGINLFAVQEESDSDETAFIPLQKNGSDRIRQIRAALKKRTAAPVDVASKQTILPINGAN